MRNAVSAGMTQTASGSHLNSLRRETSAAQAIFSRKKKRRRQRMTLRATGTSV
jgi:hypothetical protein